MLSHYLKEGTVKQDASPIHKVETTSMISLQNVQHVKGP